MSQTSFALVVALIAIFSADAFHLASRTRSSGLQMAEGGVGFKYDPSNYKDSNSGNYRRLSDQIAAVKAEEEQLEKERQELIRKEQMQKMFLIQENNTFWHTPPQEIMGTADKYFIPPEVFQIIDDLDNQLIGLRPVKDKMRRYAAQMLVKKVRE